MTGQSTLARAPGTGKGRTLLLALLALTGLVLLGFIVTSMIRFAIPPSNIIEIGLAADFPPSDQPYVIYAEGERLFLVNTGDELLAHYHLNPRSGFCPLRWVSEGSYFTDGCWGTKFNLDGSYRTGPPTTMQRYPLVIEDGKVLVDLARRVDGPLLEFGDF